MNQSSSSAIRTELHSMPRQLQSHGGSNNESIQTEHGTIKPILYLLLLISSGITQIGAFAPQQSTRTYRTSIIPPHKTKPSNNAAFVLRSAVSSESSKSHYIPVEKTHPIIKLGTTEKPKIINIFGMWSILVCLVTCPIWAFIMKFLTTLYKINPKLDPNRAFYDAVGKIWTKTYLRMLMSYPKITGHVQSLKKHRGPALFVANHASWLDIAVLCTVLKPVFKFIAKKDLVKVPCIGQQLVGGKHILIDRTSRRSQFQTFKSGVSYLQNGVSIMAFPEGQRSKDGRLLEFKNGTFSMAVKTNVPIIPITISNTHAVYPSYGLVPVQHGMGKLKVHVHEPIEIEGRTEEELREIVWKKIAEKLPMDQRPVME